MALTRMQQRRGTAAQWALENPILAAGEIGFETDEYKFKIGDGLSNWTALAYFSNADDIAAAIAEVIDMAPETLDTLNELAAAINDDPDFFNNIQIYADTAASTAQSNAEAYADALTYALDDLTDVEVPSPPDGFALVYDDDLGAWVPGELTSSLANLTDVDTSGAADKNSLIYDEDLGVWTVGPGGGKFTVSTTAPSEPQNGDTWFNSETGQSYLFYEDYDNGQWVEIAAPVVGFLDIDQLNDVEIIGVSSGNVLKYNGTQWVNDTIELADISDTIELGSLEDTDVYDPADGDVLTYNSSSGNWESTPIPPGVSLGLVIALGG